MLPGAPFRWLSPPKLSPSQVLNTCHLHLAILGQKHSDWAPPLSTIAKYSNLSSSVHVYHNAISNAILFFLTTFPAVLITITLETVTSSSAASAASPPHTKHREFFQISLFYVITIRIVTLKNAVLTLLQLNLLNDSVMNDFQ